MFPYLNQLSSYPLFRGITAEGLDALLTCMGVYTRTFCRKEPIHLQSHAFRFVGIILRGAVRVIRQDTLGNRTSLLMLRSGDVFGETFACGSQREPLDAFWADTDCEILFLSFSKALHVCTRCCPVHHRLIENLTRIMGDRAVLLMEKVEIISQKTLRDKILTFLHLEAQRRGSCRFTLSMGRLELADYLCADRSALTRELNLMQEEGLLEFHRNSFHLLYCWPPEKN